MSLTRWSVRARVADRLARFVDVRVERKLRPATHAWQRRLDNRVRPLANRIAAVDRHRQRLDRHRQRLHAHGLVLGNQRKRLNQLEKSVAGLRRELRQTNAAVERIIPQVAAQEHRIETLRERLTVAPSAQDGDAVEARRLIDEVQRQHARIRERLSGIAFYEERLRKLEATVTSTSAAGE